MTRIVYLHGFASGPASSKARYFKEHLEAAGARVDVPDLAAGDFEHLTISGQLSVIEAIAAGQPVSLMGSSMGGYLASIYAGRHPEVGRVVLLAPAFAISRRWPEWLGEERVAEWRAKGFLEFFHYGQNRPLPLSYRLLEDCASYEDYPDFRQPALIFHGIRDDAVPAGCSETFAASHPNARLEILDSGHELLNVLDYMRERITPFLLQAP
jgi:pimeloyl-ACP methyl ester carboxylesterase